MTDPYFLPGALELFLKFITCPEGRNLDEINPRDFLHPLDSSFP